MSSKRSLTVVGAVLGLGLATCIALALAPDEPLRSGHRLDGELAEHASASFKLTLEQGGYAQLAVDQVGFDTAITVIGPDGGTVIEVDDSGKGETERVMFEAAQAGAHTIVLKAFDADGKGRYAIRLEDLRDAATQAAARQRQADQRQAVAAWARANAWPLHGSEPGTGVDDLKALDPLIGDARVVLLGEATHGTREFFQLKHRMLEYLVLEKGFNVFAIEATQPEAFALNRYVLEGEGDPQKALAGLYFWTWNTEEVFEMVRWMRAYNADPAHTRKLKFYGFDMQSPQMAARHVADYLARVEPDAAGQARAAFAEIDDGYKATAFYGKPREQRAILLPVAEHWLSRFDRARDDWSRRTSARDWAIARQHARLLVQFAQMSVQDDAGQVPIRAKAMADNLLWIREHEGADSRVVGWAHNGHVTMQARGGSLETGGHLKAALGEQLRVIGFAFAQGSFQAISMPRADGGLRQFSLDAPPKDSLAAVFASTGMPLAVYDLRRLPKSGPAAQWFAEAHKTYEIGAVFDEAWARAGNFGMPSRAQDEYDALIFVERTTAARPMPWGFVGRWKTLRAPTNLDFERGRPGDLPSEWEFSRREQAFGYRAGYSDEHAHSGRGSGLLWYEPGPVYGIDSCALAQSVDAAPYRGLRVRVSAWMRAEARAGDARGHLYARVSDPSRPMWDSASTQQNYRSPVRTPEWQQRSIELEIGAQALRLDIGAVLVGDARVWIDDVVIEPLGPITTTRVATAER
jgi:erythromycin esterase